MSSYATSADLRNLDTVFELMSAETTSHLSTDRAVEVIERRCQAVGIEPVRQVAPEGGKENVLITLPDRHGRRVGGVMLSGHLDTVPVTGQIWAAPPFTPSIRDGRLFGRGAADMKAFCGVVLGSLDELCAEQLDVPVQLAFTYDEETGCAGARRLVALLKSRREMPSSCIVGEPTSMEPVAGHKSCRRIRLMFTGVAAHSSRTPDGVNAVEYAARAVAFLADLAERIQADGPHDPRFTVPHTTISTGPISGGTAINIIPDQCIVEYEVRAVPGQDVPALEALISNELRALREGMRDRHAAADLTVEVTVDVPALEPRPGGPAERLVADLAGRAPVRTCVSYGTEAGIYQQAGIDTIVLGPGSIDHAHVADEFVDLSQVALAQRFVDSLRDRVRT